MRELTPFGLERPAQTDPGEAATRLIDADLLNAAELEAWRPRLDVVQGSADPASLPLGDAGVAIGRAAGNDLVVADDRVSRNHARVFLDDGRWVIEDLNSSNGVRLDGVRVRRETLRPGCRIEIGTAVLAFSHAAPELTPEVRIAMLDTSEVLRPLTAETKAIVAERLAPRFVGRESIIIQQGATLTAMVFVHRGQVRVVAVNEEGGERLLDRIRAGECFGERALIAGEATAGTVIADTDALIVELPKAALAEVLARRPDDSQQVVATVRAKLHTAAIRADEMAARRAALAGDRTPSEIAIVGEDGKIVRARQTIERLAGDDRPVLVVGPQGSGRKTFARHLHRTSPRKAEPYVVLALAGMDPGRIAGALFGVEAEGDAAQGEIGHLELLGEGTLAITHAELLDIHQQSLLAGYLRLGWFHRTHGQTTIHSKVRVVLVATGTEAEVTATLAPELREALNGRTVALPPLTGRLKDIPLLAAHSLALHSAHAGRKAPALSREAIDKLVSYSWPGNVSELDSVMQRAAIVASEGAIIPADLIFVAPPEREAHKLNVLRNDTVRQFLRHPLLFKTLVWIDIVFVAVITALTLWGAWAPAGNPLAEFATNPGMLVTWLVWFPILPISAFLLGRIWCGVCPIAGIGDLAGRVKRYNMPVPKFLKEAGFWLLAGAFLLVDYVEELFGVADRPIATAVFLLVIVYLAVAFTVLFERKAFCHHLCPLAAVLGTYSTMGVFEVRGNKKVCQTQCGEHTCFKGTDTIEGCPLSAYPASIATNAECMMCGNCLKNCENRGVQLNLRPPLSELWHNTQPLLAMSLFAVLLVGLMAKHQFPALTFWQVREPALGWSAGASHTILFFAFGCAALVLFFLASTLSAAASQESLKQNMTHYGLAFIPLAFAGHLAHVTHEFLSEGIDTLLAYLGKVWDAIFHAIPIAATTSAAAPLVSPAIITFIKFLIVTGGLTGSLLATIMIARRLGERQVFARAMPHLLLVLAFWAGYLWIFTGSTAAPNTPVAAAAPVTRVATSPPAVIAPATTLDRLTPR